MILAVVVISVLIFISMMGIISNLEDDIYINLIFIVLILITLLTILTYDLGIHNANEKTLIQLHKEHKVDIITKTVLDSNYIGIYNMLKNKEE